MADKFETQLIQTGPGRARIFVRDGSVWLKLEDEDGDGEGLHSLSVETSTEIASALLGAAIYLRSQR